MMSAVYYFKKHRVKSCEAVCMTADEAVAYGLADKVLKNRV
jgi:ATP-dependent protease ClpP protease subunit